MARKSYDQRLKERWLEKQARDRKSKLGRFEQMYNPRPVRGLITAICKGIMQI